MKPRYYVHMGPRTADNVSVMWKGLHIIIYLMILGSASVATWDIYEILFMYNFKCIIYAKVTFQVTFEERLLSLNSTQTNQNGSMIINPESVNCTATPNDPSCTGKNSTGSARAEERRLFLDWRWKDPRQYGEHQSNIKINNTGFINLRKSAFATIYMCDLMFFAPLASIIMSIVLGALTAVGGKGGLGNPGDLLPNPWICVYPFLGLSAFMTIFSFIAQNLFISGLDTFCSRWIKYTDEEWCTEKMNKYNVQFSPLQQGPPKNFYVYYFYGSIALKITSILWVLQVLVYAFRILCLADFSTYLTRVKLKDDEKGALEPKMANVVLKMMDPTSVSKVKNI